MGDRQTDGHGPAADAQGYQGAPPPGPGAREQWSQTAPPAPGEGGLPAPKQANPKLRKRLIIGGSVAAGLLLVLAVGGFFGYKHLSEVYSPRVQVEEYLQTVVDGDIEGAMAMVPAYEEMPSYQARDYSLMTNEIYSKATNRISGFEVTNVEVSDKSAQVTAEVKQGEDTESVTFELTSVGTEAVLFEKWQLSTPLEDHEVAYRLDGEGSELAVNGVGIEGFEDSKYFAVFPGDYTFNTPAGTKYIGYSGDESVSVSLADGPEKLAEVSFAAELTDAAREEIKAQTAAHLEKCMKATELQPQGCPNKADGEDPDNFRNIKWSMTKAPAYESIEGDPSYPFSIEAVNGQFALDAEMKQGNTWGQQKGTVELYSMPAMVDIQGEEITIVFAD